MGDCITARRRLPHRRPLHSVGTETDDVLRSNPVGFRSCPRFVSGLRAADPSYLVRVGARCAWLELIR